MNYLADFFETILKFKRLYIRKAIERVTSTKFNFHEITTFFNFLVKKIGYES